MKLFLLLWISLSSLSVHAQKILEIGIDHVFVIEKGFDSNDQVEIVIDSTLPDACYKVSDTDYTIEDDIIKLKQYIVVRTINDCLPLHRDTKNFPKMPVRFSKVLNLGVLKAKNYSIQYQNQEGKLIQHSLEIKQSNINSIDDYYYAPISNVFTPELIYTDQAVNLVFTGIMNNSCMTFKSENIHYQVVNNIILITPTVTFSSTEQKCRFVQKPLQAVLNIGRITKEGRYLIHVRSMSGQSVNKTFSIRKRDLSPRGYSERL